MDKITFRNQIENLNSLTTRYNELANDLRESLTENQKEFFDEHLGASLDFLNKASSNPAISALKFKQEDIDKMRIELATSLLDIISSMDQAQVQEFLNKKGATNKFFKVDFISMLRSIGYRYHDNKYLDKSSLKLNLIARVCEIKRGNCDIDQADYLELYSSGAIDQFDDAHIPAVYKTVKTKEMD